MTDLVPDFCYRPILVLGCGNVLFGDDGFGPAVAQAMLARTPRKRGDEVCVIDAGTAVREILFDVILSDKRPEKIVVVDAVDAGLSPGELFRPAVDSMPPNKLDDFSMHQLPTSNLLFELREFCGIEVVLIACQPGDIPQRVSPGLSPPVRAAVPIAAEMVMREVCALRSVSAAPEP